MEETQTTHSGWAQKKTRQTAGLLIWIADRYLASTLSSLSVLAALAPSWPARTFLSTFRILPSLPM